MYGYGKLHKIHTIFFTFVQFSSQRQKNYNLVQNNATFAGQILKYTVMNIGENLKIIRIKKNIKLQDVADFLGVDRRTYGD
jgi:DNA-binding XRE family transcriptional regulator